MVAMQDAFKLGQKALQWFSHDSNPNTEVEVSHRYLYLRLMIIRPH